jgi:hypothetical protein
MCASNNHNNNNDIDMATKVITIKLTKAGTKVGPFDIYDQLGNLIAENVSKQTIVSGISYVVDVSVTNITIKSTGKCMTEVSKGLSDITKKEYDSTRLEKHTVACLWTHLEDHTIYNSYYGVTEPYVIEYPFSYQSNDEILQNVSDYNKVFTYFNDGIHASDRNDKVQVDDKWFNKAIIYNGQQSSGVLELVAKPLNNMHEYMKYPKFNSESKTILWTKSDNMYQYNTFWSMVKEKSQPLFLTSCHSLSIDKIVNQTNMDYSSRSYLKETIRAKDVKIRHILDDRNDVAIVTQFILAPAQNSYL